MQKRGAGPTDPGGLTVPLLSPQQERVPTKRRLRSHGSSTSRGIPQARPPHVTSGRQPCSTLSPRGPPAGCPPRMGLGAAGKKGHSLSLGHRGRRRRGHDGHAEAEETVHSSFIQQAFPGPLWASPYWGPKPQGWLRQGPVPKACISEPVWSGVMGALDPTLRPGVQGRCWIQRDQLLPSFSVLIKGAPVLESGRPGF